MTWSAVLLIGVFVALMLLAPAFAFVTWLAHKLSTGGGV